MALRTSILVGAVSAILVPWYTSAQDPPILNGLLDGREVPISFGSQYYVLHWSWLVFCFITALAWILLNAAEQKG